MPAPRIGLAVGREAVDGRSFDASPSAYATAVQRAGGLALLIPAGPPELAGAAVESIDGLVLTGGADVSPRFYGATTGAHTADLDEDRDASELALVAAAIGSGIPIFGICRGLQLLNVALGGTLCQHLEGEQGLLHRQAARRFEAVHDVQIDGGSLAGELFGADRIRVNSVHHQSVERLAASLRATGRAPDGVVEVVEDQAQHILAVQSHPECLPDSPESPILFSWLIAEARRR